MKSALPFFRLLPLIIMAFSTVFIAATCKKQTPVLVPPTQPPAFAKGADVGWITEMEAAGIKFYNKNGVETECMALLKSLGMNTIRLRVWVNPPAGYNNAADVVVKALRAKNLGMRVMIDFHYSDDWADPGKQNKPAAWATMDINGLANAVSVHTNDVLTQLKNAGVTPEWIQVGNETNDGMLWPEGRASASMPNFVKLVNAGYDAVKNVFPSAKVIVHLANGWDNNLYRWMFDGLKTNNAKYDVIGMSLYPTWASGNWQVDNQHCLDNMTDMVTRYDKEVMIVEVGMPWDQAAACKSFISDLMAKAKSVANNKCLGVLYWEPQCYNNWKGYTLGAFDNSGKPTMAMDAFQ